MSVTALRAGLSIVLAMLLPGQLLAADSASAMLYANGTAWVNGNMVPKSAAVFTGDLVQTRPDSTAHLSASGSSVMVLADSLVKFQGPAVEIEHGAVRVSTAQGLATRAGEVTVKPAGSSWTEFQVTDVDGQVQIVAGHDDHSRGTADHSRRYLQSRAKKEEEAPWHRSGNCCGRRNSELEHGDLYRPSHHWRRHHMGLAAG